MLGPMGEHSDSENVRGDDAVDEQIDDEKIEPVVEPRESDVEKEPETRPRSGAGRWLGLVALLIALAALAIALVNVIRPDWTEKFDKTPVTTAAAPAGPSELQVAEAKTKACDAYNLVGSAVTLRSNVDLGPTPAPIDLAVVETNARQTFTAGNTYLLSRVDPATPAQLATIVKNFASDLEDVAINSLAGVNNDDPAQAARLQNMVDLNGQINELCKQ